MKRLVAFFVLMFFFSPSIFAESGQVTGKILKIRWHETDVGRDWIKLDVDHAGTCGVYEGKVIFFLSDGINKERQFSMIMSAKFADKEVTVAYDDVTHKPGSFCFIRFLDIGE